MHYNGLNYWAMVYLRGNKYAYEIKHGLGELLYALAKRKEKGKKH